MEEDQVIIRMTVDEVKANPPKIFKKFLMINSRMYTDEAFEYILELVNETDSIAFIQDTQKIYTHGQYYGGDLWEDKLFYFGNFQLIDETGAVITDVIADRQKETLRIQGLNNIKVTEEIEYTLDGQFKTIKFGYDIENSIDKSVFTIDDPTAEYNLEIKDEKISVHKYIPIRVTAQELPVIEYDSKIDELIFRLDIYGNDDTKNVFITSSNNAQVTVSPDNTMAVTSISGASGDIDYLILYGDSKTQGSIHNIQKVGYGLVYANEEITPQNFKELNRAVAYNNCDCEFILDIDDDNYGWFACPSYYKPSFIDRDSNIGQGWQKYNSFDCYTNKIRYDIYRTEQTGLGHTKWIIKTIYD